MNTQDQAFPGTADTRTVADVDAHIKAANGVLPALPFAVFDEFGIGCDDRIQDHVRTAVAAALAAQKAAPAALPFIHKKTGGKYQFVGNARLQTAVSLNDMAYVVVYRGEDDALWVRPSNEFVDRFYQEGRPRMMCDDFIAAEDEAGGVLAVSPEIYEAVTAAPTEPSTPTEREAEQAEAPSGPDPRKAIFVLGDEGGGMATFYFARADHGLAWFESVCATQPTASGAGEPKELLIAARKHMEGKSGVAFLDGYAAWRAALATKPQAGEQKPGSLCDGRADCNYIDGTGRVDCDNCNPTYHATKKTDALSLVSFVQDMDKWLKNAGYAEDHPWRSSLREAISQATVQAEARNLCRKCGQRHPNPDCKYVAPSDVAEPPANVLMKRDEWGALSPEAQALFRERVRARTLRAAQGAASIRDVPLFASPAQAPQASKEQQAEPIDMVLHCPKCGKQHIDAPDVPKRTELKYTTDANGIRKIVRPPLQYTPVWTNPPHRSHLCHGCGFIWRPADVPTNGVASIKTKGKGDHPVAAASKAEQVAQDREDAERYRWLRDSAMLGTKHDPAVMVDGPADCCDFAFGPDLDAAIDAARTRGEQGGAV